MKLTLSLEEARTFIAQRLGLPVFSVEIEDPRQFDPTAYAYYHTDPNKLLSEHDKLLAHLRSLINAGRRLDAIKYVKEINEINGWGLLDAKTYIDQMFPKTKPNLP